MKVEPSGTFIERLFKTMGSPVETSYINDLRPYTVSFIANNYWLDKYLEGPDVDAFILIDGELVMENSKEVQERLSSRKSTKFLLVRHVTEVFYLLHNYIYKIKPVAINIFRGGVFQDIHSTVSFNTPGMRYIRLSKEAMAYTEQEDEVVNIIHGGNVVVGGGVAIGPYTVVHQAVIGSTIIGDGVKIGNHCSVGHGCDIGDGTMITNGVMIGGSVTIGKGCWIGMGVTIKDHIDITDGVRIGAGALVLKDIISPGTYVGSEHKRSLIRIGGYDGRL